MKTIIVEKVFFQHGKKKNLYAVATSERLPQSVCYSLTFEAYLNEWTSRPDAENLQTQIENL